MTTTATQSAKKPRASKKKAASEVDAPTDFKALAAETRKKMAAANEKGKVGREKKLDLNGAQRSGGKLATRDIPTDVAAPEFQKGDLVTVVGSTLDGGNSIRGVVTGHQPTPKGVEYLVTLPAEFDGEDGEEGAYLFRAEYLERRPTDPRDYSVPFQVGDRVRYFGPHAAHKGDWTVLEVLRSGSCVVGGDKPQRTLLHGHLRILGRADVQQALRDLDMSREPEVQPQEDLPLPATEGDVQSAVVAPEVLFRPGTRVEFGHGETGVVVKLLEEGNFGQCVVESSGTRNTLSRGVRYTTRFSALRRLEDQDADGPSETTGEALEPEQTPPAELPATPVLLSPADLPVGTLGLHAVPLAQTARSGCNVRHHYDPAAIEELAASLKAEGQIENATGRWNADGQVEIVAGESRRRAQLLREEQGETGLTLLVNIRELSDAEALSISATENMRRRSMTPLEECEAMNRLNEAGRSVEEITTMFGYRTAQPVADRILVAKNLLTAGRDALEAGKVSLAHAMVIARAPGADLQKNMLERARYDSAKTLAAMLTRGQFLFKHAKFDVEASKLEVRRDLFDAFEPYFEHKAKAMQAQTAWAEARAAKLREKGKHAFVNVEIGEATYDLYFGRARYEREYDAKAPGRGLVLFIDENSGAVEEISDVRLKGSKIITREDGSAATETVRELPASAYDAAHLLRARALRHSLLGETHRTLALTVHALIVHGGAYNGRAALTRSEAWNGSVRTAEIEESLARWQVALEPRLDVIPSLAGEFGEVLYGDDMNLKLYDHLVTLSEAELLDLLNVLVAARIYEPVVNHIKDAPAPTFLRLAEETNANAYLQETFVLTDEWLKRYPRHELVALAEEAGLGRALVEDCSTLKEMRARILEHADALHREGFVPRLVQFPAVEA